MASFVTYMKVGNKPANPMNDTTDCDNCVPTMSTAVLEDLAFDSEADARTTSLNQITGTAILQKYVKEMWDTLWNDFECKGQKCKTRVACGNDPKKPTYFEYGAVVRVLPNPAPQPASVMWCPFITLAREIKCVDGPVQEDVVPEIPKIPEPKTPKAPAPANPEEKGQLPHSSPGIPLIFDEGQRLFTL